MCFIDYISAKRRLKEADKTIYMMGGRDECQDMILAQRDMIELEMDYYKLECQDFLFKGTLFSILAIVSFIVYGVLKNVG